MHINVVGTTPLVNGSQDRLNPENCRFNSNTEIIYHACNDKLVMQVSVG